MSTCLQPPNWGAIDFDVCVQYTPSECCDHAQFCTVHSCSQATLDTTVRQLKTIIDPQKPSTDYSNANFPVDQAGRTLHLGCKASTSNQLQHSAVQLADDTTVSMSSGTSTLLPAAF